MKQINRFYDERETMFSRERLKPSSKAYQAFYQAHPHLKSGDDKVRGMDFTKALRLETQRKKTLLTYMEEADKSIQSYHKRCEQANLSQQKTALDETSVKRFLTKLGAKDIGIVKLNDKHYYSHHGGNSDILNLDNYGQKIKKRFKTAIVYLLPMDVDYIKRAPHAEVLFESKRIYKNIAKIGMELVLYLKKHGHDALLQSEAYYLTPLVPLAYDAGLGEIGMPNHIVHPVYGNRLRLNAVLTDLPLVNDSPIDYGLDTLCKQCGLCLINCPNQSIKHKKRYVNDRVFYQFDEQSCFKMFKTSGTDCAICIQSCPLSYNLSKSFLNDVKNDRKKVDDLIKNHIDTHGRRPKNKTPLNFEESRDDHD